MIDFKGYQQCNACMERITNAGHWISYVDGVAEYSDVAAIQAIIDAFTLDEARAPIIGQIKALAREKILAFLPDWKQSNFNARMNELNLVRVERAWTTEEAAEVAYLQSMWDKAKAIRSASNAHEVNLSTLSTYAEVSKYDIYANWP
jgi:hypothetical protein